MRIGIDLMGSDTPWHLLFNAVLQAAKRLGSSHSLVVIATEPVVNQLKPLIDSSQDNSRAAILFQIATDTIVMDDEPLLALRRKKGASLVVGMRMLKKRAIDAFVSCGNTGALIAGSVIYLSRLPGVVRPALLAVLPTEKGSVSVLDVGGNVSCKSHHLVQFAYLGAAYQRAINGIEVPRVGLLNVGAESKKGTKDVRQAYELLRAHSQELTIEETLPYIDFVGNVEGRDVFKGVVDVLVTDGFTGNVLLKTAEGVVSLIFHSLAASENSHVKEVGAELHKNYNYAEHPGAIICGVDGIVMKVHGSAPPMALLSSILGAVDCVQKQLISRIKQQLKS